MILETHYCFNTILNFYNNELLLLSLIDDWRLLEGWLRGRCGQQEEGDETLGKGECHKRVKEESQKERL